MSLSGLHSCVEIVMSGNWSIGRIWRLPLVCGGLNCVVISLL